MKLYLSTNSRQPQVQTTSVRERVRIERLLYHFGWQVLQSEINSGSRPSEPSATMNFVSLTTFLGFAEN